MAEEESDFERWANYLRSYVVGEGLCATSVVGDVSSGYAYGYATEPSLLDEGDVIDWNYLITGETHDAEFTAQDGTISTVTISEPEKLQEVLVADVPPPNGVVLGGVKFKVPQLRDMPTKDGSASFKTLVIALDKLKGCIAVGKEYYVIALINTNKTDNKNLPVDLAVEMLATI